MAYSNRIIVPGIYQIKNTLDGLVYVGSSWDIPKRWKGHRLLLARGNHHSRRLQKAWDEYGATAFVFEILEFCYKRNALAKIEQSWIDELQSSNPRHGYNIKSKANQKKIRRPRNRHLCLSNVMRPNKKRAVSLPDAEREAIWKAYSEEQETKAGYDAIDILEATRIRQEKEALRKKIAIARKNYRRHIDNLQKNALSRCYARGRLYSDNKPEPDHKR
jgi:group I intron endonuclease